MLLERIHVYRCTTLADQLATVRGLDGFLDAHPDVRLVVLDSVAFHFRYYGASDAGAGGGSGEQHSSRARDLHSLAQALHKVAASRGVAVLVVNQMTTAASDKELTGASAIAAATWDAASGASKLVPALGEAWAHACTSRVILEWSRAGHRLARLVKSAARPPGAVPYAIVPDGVRSWKPGACLADAWWVCWYDTGGPRATGFKPRFTARLCCLCLQPSLYHHHGSLRAREALRGRSARVVRVEARTS
jgi:RAD51-like protein 2